MPINFVSSSSSITNATNDTASDGSFTCLAADTNSINPVHYVLGTDFIYGEDIPDKIGAPGESVQFTNLPAGTYVVYARTTRAYFAVAEFTVGSDTNFQVRYRLDFTDESEQSIFRFDIEESNYDGEIVEVYGGSSPVIQSWRGEGSQDVFTPVVSSQLDVELISFTDQFFIDLFTTNERQFRGRLYQLVGIDYELKFSGFLLPMLYSEPYYTKTNYPVRFTFSDGLADLSKFEFSDTSGSFPQTRISYMDALVAILKKTDLDLQIWESVNIIHSDLDTADTDSILTQLYFDPNVYNDGSIENCDVVLKSLLSSLKSRVYQSDGRWNIELIGEKTATEVLTRKYTSEGVYISSENLTPRVYLRRPDAQGAKVALAEKSGNFSIIQTYGNYNLTYDLNLEEPNNILENGGFEKGSTQQIPGWTVTDNSSGLFTYGLEKLVEDRGDSKYAFFASFDVTQQLSPTNQTILLKSDPFQISGSGYILKIKFDIYTRPLFTGPYIFIDFALVEVNFSGVPYVLQAKQIYTDSDGYSVVRPISTDLIDGKYLRFYIDEHLSFKTIELELVIRTTLEGERDYQAEFRISSNPIYDYSVTELRAIPTTSKKTQFLQNRVRVNQTSYVGSYDLEPSDEAESLPDIIRPNDYSGSNQFVWKLKERYSIPTINVGSENVLGQVVDINIPLNSWLQSLLIDNVIVSYYPYFSEPVETITRTTQIDRKTKAILEETVRHGGLSTLYTYKVPIAVGSQIGLIDATINENYKLISNAWLSDSDDNLLTDKFKVRGSTNNLTFIEMISNFVLFHYGENRVLLTGDFDCRDQFVTFYNTIYEVRSGRIFLPISLSLDFRNNSFNAELIEKLKGEPIIDETDPIDPNDPGNPVIEPPGSGPGTNPGNSFGSRPTEHSLEFSDEFN